MPSRGVESQRPGPELLVLVDLGDARVLLLVIILVAAIGGLARLDLCIGRLGAPDGDDGRPGARIATSTFPGNAASQHLAPGPRSPPIPATRGRMHFGYLEALLFITI